MADNNSRDLVLAPGEYAFVLDTTKGLINTVVGPNKVSMSTTDQPVIWDKDKLRFVRCETMEKAIQTNTIAPEGFYVALYNPADSYPNVGTSSVAVNLKVGHRVHLPGPVQFPLWPGQMADVIKGHHLRSNQYLLAQVYNDAEATANWGKAVLKPQEPTKPSDQTPPPAADTPAAVVIAPRSFTPGQLLIIKGTEVAFFMPPTGIKVVPDETGKFIREAVTLERLEYCILLDEDGNKRFVQGPSVVFPEPTEQFIVKDGSRKFRAIELNETSGIYVKVIADYRDEETGEEYEAGDELFITGKQQAIYFQREEHSVIRYGDQTKHYAVAIPSGEGRYVLDRNTGVINLVRGPNMLLCDPRHEVIVRRVLAQGTAALWYPNNQRVLKVNAELEQTAETDALTGGSSGYAVAAMANLSRTKGISALNFSDEEALRASRQIVGDTFQRGTSFTPPRTITLDTKYEGAVGIAVWTGYAVLIVNKTGQRRVVIGPANVLLEYDETLAPLELSSGTPKTDTKLFRTVYLRASNNKVSDQVTVETKDLVKVNVSLSYRVNFADDPVRWFEVENYVRLLTDHARSLLRAAAKQRGIEDFYANAITIVRDTILGQLTDGQRPGQMFTENGMRIYDVEILNVVIADQSVAALLDSAQMEALKSAVTVAGKERQLAETIRVEEINARIADTRARGVTATAEAAMMELHAQSLVAMEKLTNEYAAVAARLHAEKEQAQAQADINNAQLERVRATEEQRLELRQKDLELDIKKLLTETEELTKRAGAISPQLSATLAMVSDQAIVERIAVSLAPMAAMSGTSAADILSKLFAGTPFASVMTSLGERARIGAGSR